jgi:hypothetical protein
MRGLIYNFLSSFTPPVLYFTRRRERQMGARSEIEKKIDKKNQEIAGLENQIKEAKSYILGLQDALRVLPKEAASAATENRKLRAGSDVAKAEQLILKEGKSLYIVKILEGIGKETTKANIRSLGGAINAYVREGRIFTRPKPNTYGHMSFGQANPEEDLPADFGLDTPNT